MAAEGAPARVRVGIDLVDVAEVEHAVDVFGDRYLDRVYTSGEQQVAADGPAGARSLAARFAAKEAAIKALRAEGAAPPWTDIEVVRSPGGWTDLRLHDAAARLADEQGITDLAVSLTHEGPWAMAVVVATAQDTSATTSTTATHDENAT